MVKAFGLRLNHSLVQFSLPTNVLQEIRSQATRLAGLQVSMGLDTDTKAAITHSIGEAFVFGYRIVMLICAGLALSSATVAWRMIPQSGDGPPPRSRSS